jgi:hypothetical protein
MASDEGTIRPNKHTEEFQMKIFCTKTESRSVFISVLMSSSVKGMLRKTKYRPVALKIG